MIKPILFTVLVCCSLSAMAATQPVNQAPAAAVKVLDVWNLHHADFSDPERGSAGIGDIIVVKAAGLKGLFDKAYPAAGIKPGIRLFLDDREFTDLAPLTAKPGDEPGTVEFKLERTLNNDKLWSDLLGKPGYPHFFKFDAPISIGIAGGTAENSTVGHFHITRIRQYWFIGCLFGLILYFWLIIKFGRTTCMLRDGSVDLSPLNLAGMKPPTPPYSLAKVQMAFWFSIILASYLFIWLITGNYELITAGSLGLIGIGAGTALGAISIDNNKGQSTISQILALEQQEAGLWNDLHTLQAIVPPGPTTPSDIQFKQNAIAQVKANINQQIQSLTLTSNNFIDDILNDVNGISFHRLQMFIWTIVLGLVFIYTVWASLSMPDFSATLLTMQGITAGTYLGFKFPEKQV